ncbi:MAG TPA: DUF4384 domain-containing protein [Blastocatellia bacterium]|nr:DUF4384 domain-containing protein [Blastocatellia bacterium]
MKPRLFARWLIIAAIGAFSIQTVFAALAAAQAEKLTWDKDVAVKRVAKPGRKPLRPRPRLELTPLLTLEYRVMKQAEDLTPQETNPGTVFHTGDRLQVRIKPNQNGYLYIIQSTEGEDGQIIFPDSRINNGRNLVPKNEEHIIPSHCESRYVDRMGNCWFWMEPPSGREIFTVIFSRDLITELDEVAGSGGTVSHQVINRMRVESRQIIKRTSRPNLTPEQGGGAGRYLVWVTNTNKRDNEELITDVVLLHKEREGSSQR